MKKVFEDDGSYIEIVKSKNPGHITVSLCARDAIHTDHITMVSTEINKDELLSLIQGAAEIAEELSS